MGPAQRGWEGGRRRRSESKDLHPSEAEAPAPWGRGAYGPYSVRASQVLLCDMLQWRAKREVVCVAPPSQGRVHRHHAGLLLLEFGAWGPGCRWFSVTPGPSINLGCSSQPMPFLAFLLETVFIADSSCFFLKHRGVAIHMWVQFGWSTCTEILLYDDVSLQLQTNKQVPQH